MEYVLKVEILTITCFEHVDWRLGNQCIVEFTKSTSKSSRMNDKNWTSYFVE